MKTRTKLFVLILTLSILFQFVTPSGEGKAEDKLPAEILNPLSSQETGARYHREALLNERYPDEIEAHRAPASEREYIPPTAEVIAETKAQVSAFDCGTVTDVPQIECEALVSLYESTNGAGWAEKTNWLQTTTVSNWFEVYVEEGSVKRLSLDDNQLNGSIPKELANLSNLLSLDLYENQLSGSISKELGKLSNLEYLVLYDNQLTGNIPAELGDLSNLQALYLENNQLTGVIPAELGGLSNLIDLDLSNNQLTGVIPAELGNLSNLAYLFLRNNQLTGSIPLTLGGLSNLRDLFLHNNQLTGGIPSTLGNLTNLRRLFLYQNHLTGSIPAELSEMSDLDDLYLHNNQLTGSIPAELAELPYLEDLNLSNNQLTGSLPTELGQLTRLRFLRLNENLFEGDIPTSLVNLENLCEGIDPDYGCWTPESGLDLGYNRLNYPVQEPLLSFLDNKDPDWRQTQAVKATIPGASGGIIRSNNGATVIEIPAGAYTGEMTFHFIPHSSPRHPLGGLTEAHNAFELIATINGEEINSFSIPLKVTINYLDHQIGSISEDRLNLYRWNSNQSTWNNAISTCPGGEYIRNPQEDWLSLPLCELGEFAFLGEFEFSEGTQKLYLPLVTR